MIILGMTLFLFGMMSGCGKDEEKSIIGNWVEREDAQTIEFFKDGTIIIINNSGDRVVGSYKLLDGSRIRIDLGGFIGSDIAEISSSRDEITFPGLDGKVEKYRKFTMVNLSGKWKIEDDRIKLYEEGKKINTGQITKDSIILQNNWLFVKQKKAELIKAWETIAVGTSKNRKVYTGFLLAQAWGPEHSGGVTSEPISPREQKRIILTINLWSDYKAKGGSTLKLKKKGTFLMNVVRD